MESHTWGMFLILITLFIKGKAHFTCFSSNSSEAKRITLIYDKHHDTRNLWEQDPPKLVPCDFSSIFSSNFSSKCSVCLNASAKPETVLLVLRNLTGSEELRMEGGKGKIFFQPIDCPRLEPIRTTEPVTKQKPNHFKPGDSESNNQRGMIGLYIFLGCFIIFLIIIWLAQKRHEPQQTEAVGSSTSSSGPESGSDA